MCNTFVARTPNRAFGDFRATSGMFSGECFIRKPAGTRSPSDLMRLYEYCVDIKHTHCRHTASALCEHVQVHLLVNVVYDYVHIYLQIYIFMRSVSVSSAKVNIGGIGIVHVCICECVSRLIRWVSGVVYL